MHTGITMTSHECHDVSNHRNLYCLLNNMFKLITRKTYELCIADPLLYFIILRGASSVEFAPQSLLDSILLETQGCRHAEGYNIIYSAWCHWSVIHASLHRMLPNQPTPPLVMKTQITFATSLDSKFMGPTWGPPGADRTKVGPMWATWTFLTGMALIFQMIYDRSPRYYCIGFMIL